MNIELYVQLEVQGGEERIYTLSVDRPYSRAPIAGELVQLDDEGTFGLGIDHVSWTNQGIPELWFMLSDDSFVEEDELLGAGYERIDIGAFRDDDEPA